LQAAILLISKTISSDSFPREFRPPDGWQLVKIMDDREYEQEIVDFNKGHIHQVRLQKLRQLEAEIRKSAQESMIRVGVEDGKIRIRKSLFTDDPSGDFWVSQLAHELGHFSSATIVEPLNSLDAKGLADEIRQAGFSCLPSDFKLWRHGLLEAVHFEGKQVAVLPNETGIYGNFFDELYANIFRFYLVAHVFMVEKKMPFKQAVSALGKWPPLHYLSSEVQRRYFSGVMEYAKEVGWERLIRAGMSSDLRGFLVAGDEVLGKERNQKALKSLYTVHGRFRLTGTV